MRGLLGSLFVVGCLILLGPSVVRPQRPRWRSIWT